MRKIEISRIANHLRVLFNENPENAYVEIDKYIKAVLKGLPDEKKKNVFVRIMNEFDKNYGKYSLQDNVDNVLFNKIFLLIFGENTDFQNLTIDEKMKKLEISLDVIISRLRQLTSLLNIQQWGKDVSEWTLQAAVNYNREHEDPLPSLDRQLIKTIEVFLYIHRSFQNVAKTAVRDLLEELDPDKITSQQSKGLKIGPLKKAEWFDEYRCRYEKISRWFHSDGFKNSFFQEIENIYRNSSDQ